MRIELILAVAAVYAASADDNTPHNAITPKKAKEQGLQRKKPEINKCPDGKCLDYFFNDVAECKNYFFTGSSLKKLATAGLPEDQIPAWVSGSNVDDADCSNACQCLTGYRGQCKTGYHLIWVQWVGYKCRGGDMEKCRRYKKWYKRIDGVQCECKEKFIQNDFLNNAQREPGEFCVPSKDGPVLPPFPQQN